MKQKKAEKRNIEKRKKSFYIFLLGIINILFKKSGKY